MIRSKLLSCCVFLAAVALAGAQPAPQTARQALIEMFFSTAPGTFQKHLPEAMRAALNKANLGSGSSALDTYAVMISQLQAGGQELQTFEAGPILLSVENPHNNSKFEIVVERDDLQADEDEIEVSFRGYKDGQPQLSGMTPRFIFAMKQETGVWRLQEITFTFKVSLTNPELLKAMATSWKSTASGSIQNPNVSSSIAMGDSNEASVAHSMRSILTAEATYAATYGHGYTCSLSDLGGMGGSEHNEHQAMLIEPRLANGKKNGYRFALTGCAGSSASKFTLTAVPGEAGAGLRAFCSDESGVIRFSIDGNSASCLGGGRPLQ